MFDYNRFKHANKTKLHVLLANVMSIDDSNFQKTRDYIAAFRKYDLQKPRLNHDHIGRMFVHHLNKDCIGGKGSSRKMLEIFKEWVVEGEEEDGDHEKQDNGKCLNVCTNEYLYINI